MAYRNRIHSSTNLTPYEILFGKKMNEFKDYTIELPAEEASQLMNRNYQIQQLIDKTRPQASCTATNTKHSSKCFNKNS
jgi:hypothetical protein